MTESRDIHNVCARQALIFVTHNLTSRQLDRFERIKTAFAPYGDAFLLCQSDCQSYDTFSGITPDVKKLEFSIEDLAKLSYRAIEKSIIPGSNHFILMWFYKNHPGYSYYWNIEYDVEYTGDWSKLFGRFAESHADFLSTHIRPFDQEPGWYWWSAMFTGDIYIPIRKRIASFNPIYRLSARAVDFLDEKLSIGWAGHHEVFIPSVLNRYGYKLEDFGGNGMFVKKGNINKFYNESIPSPLGTMRHAPRFGIESIDRRRKLLYHPVKE